ncbi:TMV resistance protein N-like [Senna tora]|uniref:TMV resistance protein N-like n=1 Tax=Senna tora TaxID=362788 RepID=A0A834TR11_9FABA|nr:TMV resistance protein N-like [Senna tora]
MEAEGGPGDGDSGGGSGGDREAPLVLRWGEGGSRRANDLTLVGRLMTEKAVNKNTTFSMIRKGWSMKEEVSIIEFHDLPLDGMSSGNVIRMGGRVGEVMVIENLVVNGRLIRNFARARILINLDLPLVAGLLVPRPGLPSIWISVRYEKLSQFCYNCGVIGHEAKACKEVRRAVGRDGKPLYGGWLGTAPVRIWEEAVVICNLAWRLEEDWGGVMVCESKVGEEARKPKEEDVEFSYRRNNGNSVRNDGPDISRRGDTVRGIPDMKARGKVKVEMVEEPAGGGMGNRIHVTEGLGVVRKLDFDSVMRNNRKEVWAQGLMDKEVVGPKWSPSGYVVEIPSDDEMDQDKIIVPFSQPKVFSDVVMGLNNFSLKRQGEEDASPSVGKRRKVFEKAISAKASISVFMDSEPGQSSGNFCLGKSSVRESKRKARLKCLEKKVERKDSGKGFDDSCLLEGFEFKAQAIVDDWVQVVKDGCGGWPSAAT